MRSLMLASFLVTTAALAQIPLQIQPSNPAAPIQNIVAGRAYGTVPATNATAVRAMMDLKSMFVVTNTPASLPTNNMTIVSFGAHLSPDHTVWSYYVEVTTNGPSHYSAARPQFPKLGR